MLESVLAYTMVGDERRAHSHAIHHVSRRHAPWVQSATIKAGTKLRILHPGHIGLLPTCCNSITLLSTGGVTFKCVEARDQILTYWVGWLLQLTAGELGFLHLCMTRRLLCQSILVCIVEKPNLMNCLVGLLLNQGSMCCALCAAAFLMAGRGH